MDSNPAEATLDALPVINMITQSRETSLSLDRSRNPIGLSDHDLPHITLSRREHDAVEGPEEEEALMASTDENEHDSEHDFARRRSVSPALGRPAHLRSASTSVDLTHGRADSRNRTPSGSRRGSHDLDDYVLGKNRRSSRSGLAHEIDKSSLSDSEGKREIGEESFDGSFPGGSYPPPVNGANGTNGNRHVHPPVKARASRKPKSNGTAEKAGVILVSLLKQTIFRMR
jgi:hypothetical protein